jgi:hypothetical protein
VSADVQPYADDPRRARARRIRRHLRAGRNLAALRLVERYNRTDNSGIRAAERQAGVEGCTGL